MNERKPNPAALLPILIFLLIYLGSGIYFEYIHPLEGQMGFYVISVVVAFGLALIVAFIQNPALSFDEKIHLCAQGIGDDNIVIMLFIFLMAGAFSGLASAAGGASSEQSTFSPSSATSPTRSPLTPSDFPLKRMRGPAARTSSTVIG